MATNVATKVKAICIEKTGGSEVLQLSDVSLPELVADEVRVKLYAAGLNFIDIYHRRGTYPLPLPYTPGYEGAGIIEAIGPDVQYFKPGDRVAYSNRMTARTSRFGSYAEATVLPADVLIPLPDQLTFVQGAAFPLQGMTAHYLLHEFYKLKAGETVLIHAAAGGMGWLLVQWAKHLGAKVIGTVSTEEKAKIAQEAGADHVIFYTKNDFVEEVKELTCGAGVDLIIDGVGKSTFPGNLEAVRKRGHIVIFGSASGPAEPIGPNSLQAKSIALYGGSLFNFVSTREEMLSRANAVLQGIHEGWLRLKIEHVLPLEQAAKAQELLETRKTTGKVVLRMED